MDPTELRCTSLVVGAEPPSPKEPRAATTPPVRRHLMRNHKRHGSSEFGADRWDPKPLLNLRVGDGRTPAPQLRGNRIDSPPETASAATGALRRAAAAADGDDRRRRRASCETRCMATQSGRGSGPMGRKGFEEEERERESTDTGRPDRVFGLPEFTNEETYLGPACFDS